MPAKHTRYSTLVYDKLIANRKEVINIENIARKINIPAITLYKYAEGEIPVPADLVSLLYNNTKDIDFLNFIIDDTDLMLIPRRKGDGDKTVLEETLDITVACGELTKTVQKSLEDGTINKHEKLKIIKGINKGIKEFEDLRNKINAGG